MRRGSRCWCWLLDRRFKFGRGRAFALYVMAYTVGRSWIEALRIDQANHFLGLRLNDWVSMLVFLGALLYFIRVRGPAAARGGPAGGRARYRMVDAPDGAEVATARARAEGEQADGDEADGEEAASGATDAATGKPAAADDLADPDPAAPDDPVADPAPTASADRVRGGEPTDDGGGAAAPDGEAAVTTPGAARPGRSGK